jgi:hypothetical protein
MKCWYTHTIAQKNILGRKGLKNPRQIIYSDDTLGEK